MATENIHSASAQYNPILRLMWYEDTCCRRRNKRRNHFSKYSSALRLTIYFAVVLTSLMKYTPAFEGLRDGISP